MAKLQYTRFEVVCDNRDKALEKLGAQSRSYAEPVVIKYKAPDQSISTILAVYKSSSQGDYEITYETGKMGIGRVFKATKTDPTQSDTECIMAAMFGEKPQNLDIVIINTTDSISTYIYADLKWNMLWSGSKTTIIFQDTETVKFVTTEIGTDTKVKADVPIDNETLVIDPGTGKLRVKKIYGGTF